MIHSHLPGGPRLFAFLKPFWRSVSGNTATMFALTLIPLAGVVGAALDYSVAITARGKLQSATDAVALASAKAISKNPNITDAQLKTIADAIFNNNVKGVYLAKSVNYTMQRLQKGVHVKAKAKVPTNVIRVLGINNVDIAADSETEASTTKVEVVMVLDNTGSMGSSGKMDALKSAANTLIETLIPDANSEFVKIGMVPYDVTVNIGTGYRNASWLTGVPQGKKKNKWCGLVKARKAPDDTKDTYPSGKYKIKTYKESCGSLTTIQTLTDTKSTLTAKVSAMQPNGWTYIPAGLMWGWRVLSPGEPMTQGKPYNDPDWKKILILMTDGANTAIWENTKLSVGVSSSEADTKTRTLCNNIKAKDIKIYSIGFRLNSSTATNLMSYCASSQDNFFAASSNEDLKAAFSAIAGDINKLRLTK